jgi:hypothetical protein
MSFPTGQSNEIEEIELLKDSPKSELLGKLNGIFTGLHLAIPLALL